MVTKTAHSSTDAYTCFTRNEWASLAYQASVTLSDEERIQLQGINETVSPDEVEEIYVPLTELLYMHTKHSVTLHNDQNRFFHRETKKVPFVIGIAGSVSVGKSTTARLIQALISRWPNHPKVDLVTTDGFLYPNQILEERGLMKRKGFPESYDIRKLVRFLSDIKSGRKSTEAPLYSHLTYDVLQNKAQQVEEPDVVIVEGINVLQVNKKDRRISPVFVSDFFDFSIYVDADEDNIIKWYVDRFKVLQNTAFQDPDSFFHRYRHLSEKEAEEVALSIWKSINGVNLEKNIRPTRYRADMILTKGTGHRVEQVQVKKS
ncbi:type I pantothenate kinase [Alkalicoccobacillus murimartini]|uniref:Pantothenate kinase n=1 Tax=Alkalicoccobacillus murimartini TaxID=171685 RepID=A0ABT9YJ61_9BACI|nr:type I pantothenate kinase [Alkalicoccobacillus murimartini]MDQ0207907.1 type I pantothenate kinase [Alkalicoccobacillus murimartini]